MKEHNAKIIPYEYNLHLISSVNSCCSSSDSDDTDLKMLPKIVVSTVFRRNCPTSNNTITPTQISINIFPDFFTTCILLKINESTGII